MIRFGRIVGSVEQKDWVVFAVGSGTGSRIVGDCGEASGSGKSGCVDVVDPGCEETSVIVNKAPVLTRFA